VFTVRYALLPPDLLPRTYYVRAVGGVGANAVAPRVGDGEAIVLSLNAKIGDKVSGLKVGNNLGFTNNFVDPGTNEVLVAVSDLVVIGTDIVAVDGVAPTAPSNLRVVDDPADNNLKVVATFTKASDDGLYDDFSGVNTARFYRVTGYNVYNEVGVVVATIPAGSISASFNAADRNAHTYTIKATDGMNVSTASNANAAIASDNTQVADFNSDRTVDVSDLALFAARFGGSSTDVEFEPLFDLNADNTIDVSDLALFAARFGQTSPSPSNPNSGLTKEAGLPSSSIEMQVRTEAIANNRIKVTVSSDNLVDLKGYQFTLRYDKNKVSFESVEQGSAIADKGLFIQKRGETEVIVAAGAYADVTIEGKATLASFILKVKDPVNLSVTIDNIMMLNSNFEKSIKAGITSSAKIIPTEFALLQNYPNPFNPSTDIRFDLPVVTNVRLVIYNITGQEVRTLINGNMDAGVQRVTWDGKDNSGKNISSGVYLYRITADKFSQTKKMMLLK
jgi:flagellar hook assembly protein FlgD